MTERTLLLEHALVVSQLMELEHEKRDPRTGEPIDGHAAGRIRGLVFRFRELDAELRAIKDLPALRYGVVPSKEN